VSNQLSDPGCGDVTGTGDADLTAHTPTPLTVPVWDMISIVELSPKSKIAGAHELPTFSINATDRGGAEAGAGLEPVSRRQRGPGRREEQGILSVDRTAPGDPLEAINQSSRNRHFTATSPLGSEGCVTRR
jgi:hypothetical protein